jgi:hypothetical protein
MPFVFWKCHRSVAGTASATRTPAALKARSLVASLRRGVVALKTEGRRACGFATAGDPVPFLQIDHSTF